jgi:MFS family permease
LRWCRSSSGYWSSPMMPWALLWQVAVLTTLFGVLAAVDNPARLSFVGEMVDRQRLRNAVTLNTTMVNVARAVGPAIAGVLVVTIGIGACFLVNARTRTTQARPGRKKWLVATVRPQARPAFRLPMGFAPAMAWTCFARRLFHKDDQAAASRSLNTEILTPFTSLRTEGIVFPCAGVQPRSGRKNSVMSRASSSGSSWPT